jgi:hypothetical protein
VFQPEAGGEEMSKKPLHELRRKYNDVVFMWWSFPPDAPRFTNEQLEAFLDRDGRLDVENLECLREQMLAVRRGLTDEKRKSSPRTSVVGEVNKC